MTTPPLLCHGREARLAAIDRLPRNLWLWSLVHSQGSLEPRLTGIEGLLAALVAGELPEATAWTWPPAGLGVAAAATLRSLQLPGYCRERREIAEAVLRSLLYHLDLIVDHVDRGMTAAEAAAKALAAFAADWRERCGEIDELVEVLGDLGDLGKNTRWDLLRGVLRSGGWREVVRIRRLLERLPELSDCIARLGRVRVVEDVEDAGRSQVPAMTETLQPQAHPRRVAIPDFPGETRGVRRSGRVARMLPAEALVLAHPRLRLVWHARHAERALLTYDDEEVMDEAVHELAPAWQPSPQQRPEQRLAMGPMLVCVDTSGSMQGGAEAVAKAIVLEAVRVAHRQRRACHVFAFGGPDDIVELAIAVDLPGLEQLAGFMGQSFRGGTDITGPLERALTKLEDQRWQRADLLIASDGEFGATPALAQRLRETRQALGLRVQGVLIGDRETLGFLELADDIFWIREWRRFGDSAAASPVPDKNLTAAYFPGALRSPQNLAATVSGPQAAAAWLRGQRRDR